MNEIVLPLGAGLADGLTKAASLAEGSYNLYPENGYLVNYPGRTDVFSRGNLGSHMDPPPGLVTPITRLAVFNDMRNRTHVVFVQGASVSVKEGNGYRVLYTLRGQNYDGRYYPSIAVHEGKLVIANFGDPVLMWDGHHSVHPLGVVEVPLPPEVRASYAPADHPAMPTDDGIWAWAGIFWPQQRPISKPAYQEDADADPLPGLYRVIVQFKDRFGNKGRPSAPSPVCYVRPRDETGTSNKVEFLNVDFQPPFVDDHITGVVLGRTANLHPDDTEGGTSASPVFYREVEFDGTAYCRFTCQVSDTTLQANGAMDILAAPPDTAGGVMSWKGWVFLWGHPDKTLVSRSDTSYFGQFRTYYKAGASVVTVVGMGDRVAVITPISVEILYETGGALAVLEVSSADGSLFGRSFVDVGGGAIFGLFNRGFAFHNGSGLEYVKMPTHLQEMYLDASFRVHSAIKVNEWYILSVLKDAADSVPNYLIMFHLADRQWYLIKEKVFDLAASGNDVLGCDNSIYELFSGAYSSDSVLVVDDIVSAGLERDSSLLGAKLLIKPSSSSTGSVDVEGRWDATPTSGTVQLLSSQNRGQYDTKLSSVWSSSAQYADAPIWSDPDNVWTMASWKIPVSGEHHRIQFTFPSGHPVAMAALSLMYSADVPK